MVLLHPLESVLCVLMVTIVAVIFAQVVTRYLLQVSLSWSEELARYLLMWLAMLSAAYGFKIKAHFALVFLVNRFPEGVRRALSLAVSILVCVLLFLFVWKAVEITWSVRRQIGPATGLSKAVPYSSESSAACSCSTTWRATRGATGAVGTPRPGAVDNSRGNRIA